MSSNAVHAPRKLTKYDDTTYPGMNDLEIIWPSNSAYLCSGITVDVSVAFDIVIVRLESQTICREKYW
jgi:hypothetical protein